MADTIIKFAFDKDAVWEKICDRKAVFLDTNCWINMADGKFPLAVRAKDSLRKLVADGLIFCSLSFGLLSELYKQAEDSRLRVGTLMEELSLNITYIPREEVFAWEVDRAVRRLADLAPTDLSQCGLYAPIIAYLGSELHLILPDDFPSAATEHCDSYMRERLAALTLTEMLKMRAARKGDGIFDFVKDLPAPKYSEAAKRAQDILKGDKHKIKRIEAETAFKMYIQPTLRKLPLPVQARFIEYAKTVPTDKYGGFLDELLKSLPAISNHIELMAATTQQPSRKDKIINFFDMEIMSVPLSYASVFVSQDKGIRDMLRNRTEILKRNTCCYCFNLAELEEWLKVET